MGFGTLRLRPDYTVRSFPAQDVDAIIAALQAANLTAFADRLRGCEKISRRSGGLEVRMEKCG